MKLAALTLALVACGASQPTAITIAGAECVSHRTALQLACVDTYATKSEIDACKTHVKEQINCVVSVDAGAEQ